MSLLRGLLDRLLLAGAVIAGGLVPGFIAQYRQRLGGRLDQARLDLAPWRQLAQQYYQGDMGRLISHHLESSDPAIRAEGGIIRTLLASVEQLQSAMAELQGSLFRQAGYLALHADPAIVRATLHDWVPTFALNAAGIVFALVFAVAVWLVFLGLWQALAWLGARRHAGPRLRRARVS
jgi:Protein of unknown function (DUF2937)